MGVKGGLSGELRGGSARIKSHQEHASRELAIDTRVSMSLLIPEVLEQAAHVRHRDEHLGGLKWGAVNC